MDRTPGASNTNIWRPAWELNPEFSDLLRPYSTAAVVYDGTRQRPELWDICNGCILWLPPKKDLGAIPDPNLSNRDAGFFDHPILVLKIDSTGPRDATVHFVKLTSLRNRPLGNLPLSWRDHYLPIHPAAPHPKSGQLLHLEKENPNRGMVENSYVSLKEGVFCLDYRALRCYSAGQKADGYRHRLTKGSFALVMQNIKCESSEWVKTEWVETGDLWETFRDKYLPKEQREV